MTKSLRLLNSSENFLFEDKLLTNSGIEAAI